jgi:hypothetical protein
MRKSVLYLAGAVILGIVITLTPLIALTFFHQDSEKSMGLLGEFRSLERTSNQLNPSGSYGSDFTVLVVSFVIAMSFYLFIRRRVKRDFSQVRFPPY